MERKLALFTVSYLNDLDQHVEWIHPFYSSIKSNFHGSGFDVDHFIFLNEYNVDKAKNNIQRVIDKYDFQEYNSYFLDVKETRNIFKYPSKRNQGSIEHPKTLENGFKLVKEKFGFSKYDYFLIEEFDVVHRANFISNFKKYVKFSSEESLFVGFIIPTFEEQCEKDNITTKSIMLSRINPCFLGFPSSKTDYFLRVSEKLKPFYPNDDESPEVNSKFSFSKDSYTIKKDTGSEFFFEIVDDHGFINLDNKFITHLSSVSSRFGRLVDTDDELFIRKFQKVMTEKFKLVKDIDYLNFTSDSIFSSDEYDQDFRSIFYGNKLDLLR